MIRSTGLAFVAMIGFAFVTTGCGGPTNYKTKEEIKTAKAAHGHDHDHDHPAGPHGGALVELGEDEYHAEVVLDHKAHALKVYLLGGDAKTITPVAATEVKVTPEGSKEAFVLKAKPQEGEADGKSSLFELADEKLVHDLNDAGFIHGSLTITIGEKSFKGNVDAHFTHDDHKHDAPKDAPAKKEETPPADNPAEAKPTDDKSKAAN